jgi:hypothetical protein
MDMALLFEPNILASTASRIDSITVNDHPIKLDCSVHAHTRDTIAHITLKRQLENIKYKW